MQLSFVDTRSDAARRATVSREWTHNLSPRWADRQPIGQGFDTAAANDNAIGQGGLGKHPHPTSAQSTRGDTTSNRAGVAKPNQETET